MLHLSVRVKYMLQNREKLSVDFFKEKGYNKITERKTKDDRGKLSRDPIIKLIPKVLNIKHRLCASPSQSRCFFAIMLKTEIECDIILRQHRTTRG